MTWSWPFALEILPSLGRAFILTIFASLAGFGVAMVLGLGIAVTRRAGGALGNIVGALTEFIRSTPLLVQLYALYYVLPQFGVSLPALAAGVLGLGLHYATYVSEVLRAGIDAVPKGQWQAARATHLSPRDTWTRVILPQAVPPMIPALANRLIAIFKETPLLAAITVPEVLLVARQLGDANFRYLEPYTEVGLLFLIASLVASAAASALERRHGQLTNS